MRYRVAALAVFLFLVPGSGNAGSAFGIDRQDFARIPYQAAEKLGAGVVNVAFSPVEILFNATNRTNLAIHDDRNVAAACFAGTVIGVGYMFLRATSGVVQVATFPIPFPRKPMMLPDVFHLTFGAD